MTPEPAVKFSGITKRYDQTLANDDVSFEISTGSMHALLGENGAGKTTLVRILAGELRPDSGSLSILGKPCEFRSPADSRVLGIRMVHQHSVMIPALSIAENFYLESVDKPFAPDLDELGTGIRTKAEDFGLDIAPETKVGDLPFGQRQWVEVFRALFNGGSIIILDEPTALLSPKDSDLLLGKMRSLTKTGITVILITHKMREVFEHADEVTVLAKGRLKGTRGLEGTSRDELLGMMVGKDNKDSNPDPNHRRIGDPILQMKGVSHANHRGKRVLDNVSLSLKGGCITGLAGISGNGQEEIAGFVAGISRPSLGTVESLSERPLKRRYVPEDRTGTGTAPMLSVEDNLVLRDFRDPSCCRRGLLDRTKLRNLAEERVQDYSIKAPSLGAPVKTLSGGNIQRVLLARELSGLPDVLVVHNPTAGLDLATTAFVRGRLGHAAASGCAVLLISEELDELLQLSDEIVVIHDGKLTSPIPAHEASREKIASMMVGEQDPPPHPDALNSSANPAITE